MMDYWEEALACSLDEHGVVVTQQQLIAIARDMELAQEHHGMAFHVPENPLIQDVERLKSQLDDERRKVTCRNCQGAGRIILNFLNRSSDSECSECRGYGRK